MPDIMVVLKLINSLTKGNTMIDYAMFSEKGNHKVHNIVIEAKQYNHSWNVVFDRLCELGKDKEFSEATDTMVREIVFDAIGYSSDVSFYGVDAIPGHSGIR